MSISFLAIIAIVNSLGVIPSAGVGVAEKLCMFIMLVPSSFMQSLSAFVAQNIGANRNDRAVRAMVCGMLASLLIGVAMAFLAFFPRRLSLRPVCQRSSGDCSFRRLSARLRCRYPAGFLPVLLFRLLQRLRQDYLCHGPGIAGAFLVRIPVSFLMSRIQPVSLFLVGLATPCSTVVQILLCAGYFICFGRKRRKAGSL